jgi:hypothetical protein
MCRDITIEPGAGINIDPGADLTVYGDWDNGGAITIGEGRVIFAGISQIVTGTTTFGHITVEPGTYVNLMSSGQKVTGIILCNGTLDANNNNLTLLSSLSGTALISGKGFGNVIGTVTLQRLIPASKAKGYKHYSSAFSNAFVGQFSNFITLYLGSTNDSPYPTMFKFSEAAATPYFGNGWIAAAPKNAVNTLMNIGVGYTVQFGSGSPVDITTYLYGTLNNGPISVPLTRLNPGSGKGDGWNLIGNPYPSPIDLDKINYTAANINKSVSIFISTSMYYGYYGYYNAQTHYSLNGGSRYLGSLHGCFVQCNDVSGGTFNFSNSIRSDVLNTTLYKNDNILDMPFIKLTAVSTEINSLKDETAVMFLADATYDNDADYDAGKLINTDPSIPNIYTVSNNNKLAINGLPDDFSSNIEIPVGFSVKTGGIYSISADEILNIPAGIDVYLEDKTTGKLQNLVVNPAYTFAINTNYSSEDRFALILGNVDNTGLSDNDDGFGFAAWSNGEQFIVDVRGQKNIASIQLYDALGRLILKEIINADGRYTYSLDLPAGAYTVRYLSIDKQETVKVFMH